MSSKNTATQVKSLGTRDMLKGKWRENCAMLCLPGGADMPYCKDLNGHGNELIRGLTLQHFLHLLCVKKLHKRLLQSVRNV